jgi:hypothetical protein
MLTLSQRVASRYVQASVLYTAVTLDHASRRALLQWWTSNVGPLLDRVVAHHMTLKFKPSPDEVARTPLGDKASLQVVGFAQDDKVQAVLVKPSVPSSNALPHVTVSVGPGGRPVMSNDLLARGYERVSGPRLTGVVEGVTPRGR